MISGKPLDTIVTKIINTENATWYKPIASAPMVLDKNILNKKPKHLVKIENAVIKTTALPKDFTYTPQKHCINQKLI
jgi:hypothetical protein